jgi:hypothetical protein
MTELEWENSNDPLTMLHFLQETGTLTERKGRLFAVACCRRVWHLFTHQDMLRPVVIAEQFAEGTATEEELRQADELAVWAGDDASWQSIRGAAAGWAVAAVARRQGGGAAQGVVCELRRAYADDPPKQEEERLAHCHLLRDIFRPFAPLCLPSSLPNWDGVISDLALAAYTHRLLPEGTLDPGRLAVLSDALEENGVTDEGILNHLRSPGPHVRGCFALDAVLDGA